MAFLKDGWLVEFYAPLDLLSIPRALHNGYDSNLLDSIGLFYEYRESASSHIVSFIKVR